VAGVLVVLGNAAWVGLVGWLWWKNRKTVGPEDRGTVKIPSRVRFEFDERCLRMLEEIEAAGLEVPFVFHPPVCRSHGSRPHGLTSEEGATL
jgi:hypothetical protein